MNDNQLLIENKRLRMIIEDLEQKLKEYKLMHQQLLNQTQLNLRFEQ